MGKRNRENSSGIASGERAFGEAKAISRPEGTMMVTNSSDKKAKGASDTAAQCSGAALQLFGKLENLVLRV